jgi:nitrate/nitrite transport system ATP-binding protein
VAFIELSSVSKRFGSGAAERHVIDDVNFSVEQSEFVSIVGFMGCGKSTLVNIIAGLVQPDTGAVQIDGIRVTGMHSHASIVFQNYSLLPWFSALENVRLAVASRFCTWSRPRQTEHARQYLERVGLGDALDRRPSQLSGGMRQRVAIARAFATEPQILLLDEPFGALDAITRGQLQQSLVQLSSDVERPVTTIMITNSVEEALLLSDRIVPMTRGPRATLGVPVTVEIPKPRSLAQLLHDKHAVHVRAYVVESLTDSIRRIRRDRRFVNVSPAVPEPAGGYAAEPTRSEA